MSDTLTPVPVPETPAEGKPKIFLACFSADSSGKNLLGYAMAEDGECLATHLSSSVEWSKFDMGYNRVTHPKKACYDAKYPEGYELVWVDETDHHAGWQAALVLNRQLFDKEHGLSE